MGKSKGSSWKCIFDIRTSDSWQKEEMITNVYENLISEYYVWRFDCQCITSALVYLEQVNLSS